MIPASVRRMVAAALALSISACSADKPPPPRALPTGPRFERDLDPNDLLPADLDLVVRVDLARMRAGIGAAAADALARRAVESGPEREIAEALGCADVVWIGARAAELDTGDRVTILEGKSCMPELGRSLWEKAPSPSGKVLVFDRKGEAPRAGTARIMNLGNRATVFVSPVELESVERVLGSGPDAARGVPRAEGLLSLDLRPRPLSPGLARRYPSIASVLAGIERVRGTALLVDDGLRVSAEVLGKTPAGAEKAGKFLDAVRESLKAGRFAEAAKDVRVEVVGKAVAVKVTVPAKVLLGVLGSDAKK